MLLTPAAQDDVADRIAQIRKLQMNLKTPLQSAMHNTDRPRLDKLMALLGGPIRLDIIRLLAQKTESVSVLADKLDHSIGLVSHNLKLLREQNIVISTRAARHRFYSLAPGIQIERTETDARLVFEAAEGEKVNIVISLAQDTTPATGLVQADSDRIDRFTNANNSH
ncbi:MAG: ArsR family transcriptional regulator [Phycisphaerales bacterium]|nr:ArsR family transcriptional regulator [Phycisphaerales bacterium]